MNPDDLKCNIDTHRKQTAYHVRVLPGTYLVDVKLSEIMESTDLLLFSICPTARYQLSGSKYPTDYLQKNQFSDYFDKSLSIRFCLKQ